jgi:outer membrane autotransporter protein
MSRKPSGLALIGFCGLTLATQGALAADDRADISGAPSIAIGSALPRTSDAIHNGGETGQGTVLAQGGNAGPAKETPAAQDRGIGVWGNAAWTHLRNTFPGAAFSGDSYSSGIGADLRVTEGAIVGIAATGEYTKLDTSFNQGHLKTGGWGLGPYAAVNLTDNFYVDALAIWSWLHNDVDRANGAVTGNYDSRRWIGLANLNGRFTDGAWRLQPYIGYLYVHQKDDAYTETGTGAAAVPTQTVSLGQGRLGGKVGYQIDQFTPYIGARWEHNFVQPTTTVAAGFSEASPSSSREGAFVQIGVNADLGSALTGGLEANTLQKSDQETYSLLGTLRYQF